MFDAHVPAEYRDQAPRVVDDDDGVQQWWYGDLSGRNLGLNASAGKPRECSTSTPPRYDEMRPGCFDVHERVRDMSAGGQLAGLNFPNWTGFSGQVLNQGPDRDVNMVMIKAYNDWHVDEWCGAYPDRFIPCGILPLFDVELGGREVRRLAAKGCTRSRSRRTPRPCGMPSIHSGSGTRCSPRRATRRRCCAATSARRRAARSVADAPPSVPMAFGRRRCSIYTLGDLSGPTSGSGSPTLKFSLTEGDIGWIPYFLAAAEHVHKRHSGWTRHKFPDDGGPPEFFRDHILCCFIARTSASSCSTEFNIDNVCWESDYPHSDTDVAERARGGGRCWRPSTTSSREDHPRERDAPLPVRSLRDPAEGAVHGRRRCGRVPDVDTVTRVGRPATERDAEIFKYVLRGIKVPASSGKSDRCWPTEA